VLGLGVVQMLKPLELPTEQLERWPLPRSDRMKPPSVPQQQHLHLTNSASF
jgi:hypothetical protein